MTIIEYLEKILEKQLGDEWIGANGLQYKLDKHGLWFKEDVDWFRESVEYIDENIEQIKEVWEPKHGDIYYYIDSTLGIESDFFVMSDINVYEREGVGNCFESQEEALKIVKKIEKLLLDKNKRRG